ncbi:MAG: ABC transporter permease subunit [Actinomycetota bacterium]|nr:ABC transporter permease subunit [Actinomycetota bacterium]
MTSTSASVAGESPAAIPPPRASFWRRHATALAFLGPALFMLLVWYVYPTIATVVRSLFSDSGNDLVWFDNYKRVFTDDVMVTAIKNNAIWVAIVPAAVTALGLVFAVLLEKIRWSVAFKFALFAPLAISLFAAGVIWRSTMYEKDPSVGAINHVLGVVKEAFSPPGVLAEAKPSTKALAGSPTKGLTLGKSLAPGDTALLGLTAIPPQEVPRGAKQAAEPEPASGAISGVVWRDFKPGGGKPGVVEQGEQGLPGVTVELRDARGNTIQTAETEADGSFAFRGLGGRSYKAAIGAKTFAEPFGGVSWLGPKLITPAIIIAYLWTAAGFAMVVIGAGLAAIPRDVLEAARTDGASEFQVFRRVTAPLLAPVLGVVFVTQIIGVLKVFDIVLAIAPSSSRNDATVLAFEMWRKSFSGQNQFGVGAALAVFLFVLVIPILILNIRRFRREAM